MNDQIDMFDLFSAPDEPAVVADPEIMVIEQLTVGEPPRMRGYIGKYRRVWLTVMNSAAAFEQCTDAEKQGMQDRLRAGLEEKANARWVTK